MIDFKTIPQRYQRYYTYLEPVITDPLVRGYFSLVASLLLVTFFLAFALSPTVNTILSLQKKITDQKVLVAQLDTKIANLVIARQNYSQVENLIPTLETALPKRPSPQVAIGQIITVASSSAVNLAGVQFRSVTFESSPAAIPPSQDLGRANSLVPGGLSVLPFSLSVSGTKENVYQYLKKLEDALRYMRFSNLSFTFTSGIPKITVDASGLTYYYVVNYD